MTDLTAALMQCGLLQFGTFGEDSAPFHLNLHMLPAYPDSLRQIAAQAAPLVQPYDRLVSMADAVPFGVALALQTGIPLVYSRGSQDAAVHDLVGAYDIGHPAVLLANTPDADGAALIEGARRVGLNIHHMLVIVDTGQMVDGVDMQALLSLRSMADRLAKDGTLPDGHARLVAQWLNHHPD